MAGKPIKMKDDAGWLAGSCTWLTWPVIKGTVTCPVSNMKLPMLADSKTMTCVNNVKILKNVWKRLISHVTRG
jgi:hypothetical protein